MNTRLFLQQAFICHLFQNQSPQRDIDAGSSHFAYPQGPSASYQGAEAQAWVADNEPESTVNEARAVEIPSRTHNHLVPGLGGRQGHSSRYSKCLKFAGLLLI